MPRSTKISHTEGINAKLVTNSIYNTKIARFVCPPNISETVAVRIMKLAHRPRIASTTITLTSKPIHSDASQYRVNKLYVHYLSFVIPKSQGQGPVCEWLVYEYTTSLDVSLPPLLPCSLPSSLNPSSTRFLPPSRRLCLVPSLPRLQLKSCRDKSNVYSNMYSLVRRVSQ